MTLTATAALVVLAVWCMRPVARRGIDERMRGTGLGPIGRLVRWLPGPSIEGNPVLWREWHRSRPSRWLVILVILIGGSTGVACLIGAYSVWRYGLGAGPPTPLMMAAIMGLLIQVIFGLLMLSAVAPMSMSEERQRGSLDLLAATTLSTLTIAIGKWLGALRSVALLAVSPAVLGFALAAVNKPSGPMWAGQPPRYYLETPGAVLFIEAGLLVATILVHGALIASVGLALAVWMKRQGRAIAFSVGFAVLVGAGWPIFIMFGDIAPPEEQAMASLSPVVAVGNLVGNLGGRRRDGLDLNWWAAFWDVECLVLALGLLWLTVRTFDGCFGRMPERPRRASVLSDVIVILAALLGAGGLFAMIAQWTRTSGGYSSTQRRRDQSLHRPVGDWLRARLGAGCLVDVSEGRGPDSDPGARPVDPGPADGRAAMVGGRPAGPAAGGRADARGRGDRDDADALPGREEGNAAPRRQLGGDRHGSLGRHERDHDRREGGATAVRAATAAEIAAAGVVPPAQARGTMLMLAAVATATVLAHGLAFVSLARRWGSRSSAVASRSRRARAWSSSRQWAGRSSWSSSREWAGRSSALRSGSTPRCTSGAWP